MQNNTLYNLTPANRCFSERDYPVRGIMPEKVAVLSKKCRIKLKVKLNAANFSVRQMRQ